MTARTFRYGIKISYGFDSCVAEILGRPFIGGCPATLRAFLLICPTQTGGTRQTVVT